MLRGMNKRRLLAAMLWFYTGWTAGAFLDFAVIESPLAPALGPLLGALAAALVVGDPRRIIWRSDRG
jgi:hypothetical protein